MATTSRSISRGVPLRTARWRVLHESGFPGGITGRKSPRERVGWGAVCIAGDSSAVPGGDENDRRLTPGRLARAACGWGERDRGGGSALGMYRIITRGSSDSEEKFRLIGREEQWIAKVDSESVPRPLSTINCQLSTIFTLLSASPPVANPLRIVQLFRPAPSAAPNDH